MFVYKCIFYRAERFKDPNRLFCTKQISRSQLFVIPKTMTFGSLDAYSPP